MNSTRFWTVVSLVGVISFAGSTVYAQRGGGGGHGGGSASGGGMPSGMQQHGRPDTMRSTDFGRQSGTSMSFERPLRDNRASSKTANDLIQLNTRLSDNLSRLLPTGTDMQTAASGFENLGEFVAAVHVSSNLGVSFDALKSQMLNGDSLGEAIHVLNPNADAQAEARKARAQAKRELGSS